MKKKVFVGYFASCDFKRIKWFHFPPFPSRLSIPNIFKKDLGNMKVRVTIEELRGSK